MPIPLITMRRRAKRMYAVFLRQLLVTKDSIAEAIDLNTFPKLSRPRSIKSLVAAVLFGLLFLSYITIYILWSVQVTLPDGVDLTGIAPFEPDIIEDFPEGDFHKPRIPRIIHWTFKDPSIPPCFQDNVKALVDNNPTWTFYMWTDESARAFMEDNYPELLPLFDSYIDPIRRADFIRYVVLYEIGGVYVDLDVINYRPLDRLTSKYTCIFPTEPFEHSIFKTGAPYLINNAIMICKPKHPFIKQILDQIVRFVQAFHTVDSTGPSFVTTQLMMYNNLGWDDGDYDFTNKRVSSSPYFYKSRLPEDHEDAVYVPNTQYFCNNFDARKHVLYYSICRNFVKLSKVQKRACANLAAKGMVRQTHKYAFLEHQFYRTYALWHFYNYLDIYLYIYSKDIRDLVPDIIIYKGKK